MDLGPWTTDHHLFCSFHKDSLSLLVPKIYCLQRPKYPRFTIYRCHQPEALPELRLNALTSCPNFCGAGLPRRLHHYIGDLSEPPAARLWYRSSTRLTLPPIVSPPDARSPALLLLFGSLVKRSDQVSNLTKHALQIHALFDLAASISRRGSERHMTTYSEVPSYACIL